MRSSVQSDLPQSETLGSFSLSETLGAFDYTQFWSFRNWNTIGHRSITEIPDSEVSESNSADSDLNMEFRIVAFWAAPNSHACKKTVMITHSTSLWVQMTSFHRFDNFCDQRPENDGFWTFVYGRRIQRFQSFRIANSGSGTCNRTHPLLFDLLLLMLTAK